MNPKKLLNWSAPALFVTTLLINYISTTGVIFPNTQADVSDRYVNLLAPAGFAFSIWGVIYFGVILSLSLSFTTSENDPLGKNYREKVVPPFLQWMTFNIIWIITWSYQMIFLSLLTIVLYALTLLKLALTISKTPALQQAPWRLTYPVGLHAGWLATASFVNLTTLLVSWGFDGTGSAAVAWTIAMMVIIVVVVTYFYRKTGNHTLMIPALWALVGIMAKHAPNSAFPYATAVIFYTALGLFILGIAIYVYLFRKHKTKTSKSVKLA